MFQNMTIRNKLLLLAGLLLLLLATLVASSLVQVRYAHQLENTLQSSAKVAAVRPMVREAIYAYNQETREWKNVLIRGNDPVLFRKHYDLFIGHARDVERLMAKARAESLKVGVPVAELDRAKASHDDVLRKWQAALKTFDAADPSAGAKVDAQVSGINLVTLDLFENWYRAVNQRANAALATVSDSGTKEKQRAYLALAIGAVLGLFALVGGLLVQRNVNGSIASLAGTVDRLNAGDLDARATLGGNDELGKMGTALNLLLDQRLSAALQAQRENEQLNNSVVSIMTNVAQLAQRDLTVRIPVNEDVTGAVSDAINMMTHSTASALQQVNAISRDVSQSSSRVKDRADAVLTLASEATQQANAASDELGATAAALRQIGEQAQTAGQDAERAIATTADALNVVGATVSGITNSREQIRETEKRVKRLAERSQEISSAVNIIGQIAERTSVLALNASMQAVAAGDAGRGFAVVADEVKRLAENAREATQQITGLVNAIQLDTAETLQAMNGTISQVVDITRLADRAGMQMNDTRRATEALANSVRSIASTTQAQSQASQRLLTRAQELIKASQLTMEEIAQQRDDTNSLNTSASALVKTVSAFQLPGAA